MHMLIDKGEYSIPIDYALNLYKSGQYNQSFYYFSHLSEKNHPIAQYFIAVMKYYGKGCNKDQESSFQILKHLSKHGIDRATEFLEDHF